MAIFTVGSKCLTASLQNSLLHNTRFTISTCIGPRPTIRTVIHDLKSSAFVNKYISRSLRSTKGQNMRKDKLPFEVDTNLPTDVAIYSYNNDKMFKMISAFGVVQFIFWGNIAYFSYSMPSLVSKGGKNPFSENSWWAMIANVQSKYKTHLAVACLGLGKWSTGIHNYIYFSNSNFTKVLILVISSIFRVNGYLSATTAFFSTEFINKHLCTLVGYLQFMADNF